MPTDFLSLRARIQSGQTSAASSIDHAISIAQSAQVAPAFLRTDWAQARAAAQQDPHLPLTGISVSVKALFDVQGWPTCAGSQLLAHAAAASTDAPAVARLRAAGASIIGHTHMVEFAFSGVGTNPHYATPTAWDALHQQTPLHPARVPGGSSSGAAVSVASGAAWIGLGSDTGGSIRIPAALNGIVGFKPTASLVPTAGSIPLSTSLDTACAMTRSVRDAIAAHEILAARTIPACTRTLRDWRLAVPSTLMLEQLDPTVQSAFERTIEHLRRAGAHIETIELPELLELADINAQGGLTAAESYAWHQHHLYTQAHLYDPRVHQRILRGSAITPEDYQRTQQRRAQWIARMDQRLRPWDALLSPTTPITAPTLDSVAPADKKDPAQDAARNATFTRVNGLLLRNTSVVNMLDGCALSLPCHQLGELPTGLMVWHGALHDDAVLHISAHIEAALHNH